MLLDECYSLRLKINELDEDIEDLESKLYSSKNQIISDMPRGGGGGNFNKTDRLLNKKWLKERKRGEKLEILNLKWRIAKKHMFSFGATEPQIVLMYLRYHQGLKWKACESYMKNKYGEEWNENKVYSTNRYILDNMHKLEQ